MNKKSDSKLPIILFISILILVLVLLIIFGKKTNTNTKLNLSEKKWIENNRKNVINVSIANNIPIFSNEGEGVFFDFINEFEKNTNLSFNLISYDGKSTVQENDLYFEIVKQDKIDNVKNDDMIFFRDYYVLVGKNEEKIVSPDLIYNKKIGVLSNDIANVSYYLTSENGISYAPYKEDEIINSLEKGEVDYVAVPKTKYLADILSKKYHIVYNITELKECYVLKMSNNTNKILKSIVNKNYKIYNETLLNEKYNEFLISLLLDKNDISEKSKADFMSKKYVFGYVENEPYTSVVNNKLIGLDAAFLNSFETVTKTTFEIKKYRNVDELTKNLNNGNVDIAPNYYNYSSLSGDFVPTISPYNEEYVVLVNNNRTDLVINSVKSLKGKDVITTNSSLAKYLSNNTEVNIKSYDKVKTLLNNIKKDSIIVLDKNIYDMYKDSKLTSYRVIYSDKENLNYGYIIRKANENSVFETLFTKYIEIINYKQLYNNAWKTYLSDSKEINHIYLYILSFIGALLAIWLLIRNKVKGKKLTKREETMRYIDPLTSLKNRNYLNKNFKSWENNTIYPQSIIVINLNNLRHINDVYGHEEGDKLIKLAANVLIRNQLDQSDIIRTDGNEYLIYMVGYEKNKVVAYMRKLYKELGELPYGFGATLGYSMIEDDIKTIDDAINEAVLEIRANKEMNNKNK